MTLQTEFEFTLPKGFVDKNGDLHRRGVMRLATARDELEPLRDPRVADNESYLTILVLSRVIVELGDVSHINPSIIENLFAADLAYLQDFYGIVNFGDPAMLEELDAGTGPTEAGPAEAPAPAKKAAKRATKRARGSV